MTQLIYSDQYPISHNKYNFQSNGSLATQSFFWSEG